jgi:pimeloyl-ACP methyl ester carboxylesterase
MLSLEEVVIKAVDPPKFLSSQALTELYLERPVTLIAWSLGTWFCMAMQLQDPTLKKMEAPQALTYINNAGYAGLPHLEKRLESFNAFNRMPE